MACVQRELEENQKSIAELSEQLKKLEDEAGEVMKDCQEAEVGTFHPLCFPFLHRNFFFSILVYPEAPSSYSQKDFS